MIDSAFQFALPYIFIFLHYAWIFLPLWLPILLLVIGFQMWLAYIRAKFIEKEGSVLLEIKLPREITKSPIAMEVVLNAMQQAGKNTYIDAFITGKVRPWFSLELVSIGGQIKFYIWTRPKLRKVIESQIYAQYPDVEIHEADDYTKDFFHPGKLKKSDPMPLWGTYFKLTKDDIYPIKTYVDYGLDKDPKEEFKIDPMTAVLEFMGSVGRGEQIWIQILVQAHRKETLTDARLQTRPDWTKAGQKEIGKLLDKLKSEDKEGGKRFRQATKGEASIIEALERSLTKYPFEVCIRAMYLAETGSFNPVHIGGLIGSLRQYGSPELNGFKISKPTTFDYPWQDFMRKRQTNLEQRMLNSYKHRSFFHPPHDKKFGPDRFILNTEELATIFHFPGSVATTPTIQKTMSKKGEAPPNLPI